MSYQEEVNEFSPVDLSAPLFDSYRVSAYRGGKLFTGALHPYYVDRADELRRVLKGIPGDHDLETIDGRRHLTLNIYARDSRPRYLLHLGLLLVTFLTVTASGAVQQRGNLLPGSEVGGVVLECFASAAKSVGRLMEVLVNSGGDRLAGLGQTLGHIVEPMARQGRFMAGGLPFSVALLTILGAHELCHYLAARRRGIRATLPYFIPAPFMIGTLGALIRVRSPFVHRRALLEVGLAGPLASFVLSTISIALGLWFNVQLADISWQRGLLNRTTEALYIHDSLLTSLAFHLRFGFELDLGTVAMNFAPLFWAGWIGLFVTMLNLLPVGQLDGGHVLYALGRRVHQRLQRPLVLLMLGAGLIGLATITADVLIRIYPRTFHWLEWMASATPPVWPGWMLWALAVKFIIRPVHPPVLDESVRLGGARTALAVAGLIILVLTFLPNPFSFLPPPPLPTGGELV